jgi:hypothetical protein
MSCLAVITGVSAELDFDTGFAGLSATLSAGVNVDAGGNIDSVDGESVFNAGGRADSGVTAS